MSGDEMSTIAGATVMSISFEVKRTAKAVAVEHAVGEKMTPLLHRVRSEFLEMPGLRLTPAQAARLGDLASHDPNRDVRISATSALGGLGHEAVAPLVAMLEDPDKDIRIAACESLGMIKDPSAAPHLLGAKGETG